MTKKEFINKFARENSIMQKDSEKYIDSFLKIVGETLLDGDVVQFVGFGKFESIKKEAREGRNPSNGEAIKIAAKKVVKFKPGSALIQKLNEVKIKK